MHHPETLDIELAAVVKWTWGFYLRDSSECALYVGRRVIECVVTSRVVVTGALH